MYLDYFGLNRFPFSIAPDPDLLYLSPAHHEALAHLNYALTNHGGLICLTGEVGMGKTTLCRAFIEQAPEQVDIAYIFNPMLSASELLQSICSELEIPFDAKGDGSASSNKELIDILYAALIERYSRGRKVICIIDEAQSMPAPLLEQIRLLTNLETNKDKLLTLILVGQPELQDTLAQHHIRQLDQRITARYHLSSMTEKQLKPYLQHRLALAGCPHELFSHESIKTIWKASKGIPRLINSIADRALLGVYATGKRKVDKKISQQAIIEVVGGKSQEKNSSNIFSLNKYVMHAALLFILIALSFIVFFAVNEKETLEKYIFGDNHFQALSQSYGLTSQDDFSDCLSIETKSDYSCLSLDWSLRDLKKLKRPMAAFDGLKWKVMLSNELIIEPQQVVVLWKPLEGFEKPIYPGESSPVISWVRKKLDSQQALPAEVSNPEWQIILPKNKSSLSFEYFYDPVLADKVSGFQKEVGLKNDRIVGLKTILVLQERGDSLKEYGGAK